MRESGGRLGKAVRNSGPYKSRCRHGENHVPYSPGDRGDGGNGVPATMPRATAGTLDRIEPGSVCLIKPSSLGDVVHALPVLSALRERWPRARFAWVVNRGLRELVEGHPALDEVIPFDRG